jgi:signal transduction histidine kinase
VTAAARAGDYAPALWWRFRQWPGRLFDLGVVLALLAVGVAVVLATTNAIPRVGGEGHIGVYLTVLVPLAALLVRRNHPLLTFGVVVAALIAEAGLRSPVILMPIVLVAVYTIAARLPWCIALPLTASAIAVYEIASGIAHGGFSFADCMTSLVPIAAAFVVGVYAGTRVAYIDSLRARAEQLAREHDLLAQQAAADERVRIARELHDVVAHHLSLVTVQAGALQTQLQPDDPARVTAEVIAKTGRQAMDEMRRMLGVLRLGDGVASLGRRPQPTIADVRELVDETRAAGVDAELVIEGEARQLPEAVELSAYRIVQEALTNVLRHAGQVGCSIQIAYDDDSLRVTVRDNGSASPAAKADAGHGIVGMRERVALFGGTLFAGPKPGGGFAVEATLPVHVPPATA